MAVAGRRTIEERYLYEVAAPQLATVLRAAAETPHECLYAHGTSR